MILIEDGCFFTRFVVTNFSQLNLLVRFSASFRCATVVIPLALAENLTKWGYNDVQRQYPNKAFGGHREFFLL
jgi:hypothetical protein